MKAFGLALLLVLVLAPSTNAQPVRGKLTIGEYRTLTAYAAASDKFEAVVSKLKPAEILRRSQRLCEIITGPSTRLIRTYRRDCDAGMATLTAFAKDPGCEKRPSSEVPSSREAQRCYSRALVPVISSVEASLTASDRADRVLRERGLRGACASALLTPSDVRELIGRLPGQLRKLAGAYAEGNVSAIARGRSGMMRLLDKLAKAGERHSFAGLRSCPRI